MPKRPPARLIDLHVDWPLQYATESTVFDPDLYPDVTARLGQVEGYLGATWAAVVALYRRADDWTSQADPWRALIALLARVEAEFAGRLLMGPDDLARWKDDLDGLTWAMIGVEGLDFVVRTPDDLARLDQLFERGVRVFQPVYSARNAIAGSSAADDDPDRGMTELGRAVLDRLAGLDGVARPIMDLAHLGPRSMIHVLKWFEADPDRPRRLLPIYSHGTPVHPGFDTPRAISRESLARLRAIGGTIGLGVSPPFFSTAEQLRAVLEDAATLPYLGRLGYEGLTIGTDFLGVQATLPGLGRAEDVAHWLGENFDKNVAKSLIRGNAERLFDRALGGAAN